MVGVLSLVGALGCAAAVRPPSATGAGPPGAVEHGAPAVEPRCGSAYRRLCGPGSQAADAREARQKEIAIDVERATLEAIAAQLGQPDVATREGWRAHLDAQAASRREGLTRLFAKARALEVALRVAPLETIVRAEHARLQSLAIARLHGSPAADAGTLARLTRSQLAWIDPGDAPSLPRAVRRGCGDHLLVDDAWVTKDATRITLCPGFLLVSAAASGGLGDLEALRASISFLIAHEIGHVIAGPTVGDDEARAAEVEADGWAAEILAARLASLPDRAAREVFLRRSVDPICAPEGDATHAPGSERVALVVARDPRVAAVLLCEPDAIRRPSGT